MMTVLPSSTNFFAKARPMPVLPPVIRIVLPERFMGESSWSCVRFERRSLQSIWRFRHRLSQRVRGEGDAAGGAGDAEVLPERGEVGGSGLRAVAVVEIGEDGGAGRGVAGREDFREVPV